MDLPSITVHRIPLRNDLVQPEDRRRPAPHRFERAQPNKLWQMDYKGVPPRVSAQLLPEVFAECGVSQAMLLDHGTPWWNTQSAWGLTRVSLWLMKQDIQIIHSAIRHPQTQGKVEASNRSIQRQLRHRGWPEWLRNFRQEWNHVRPHEAL